MLRVEVPDMGGHLCPALVPGAAGALADGLVAKADVVAGVRAVGWVEALAMDRPNASVPASATAPTAVPVSGLVIRTLFSSSLRGQRLLAQVGPGDPPLPVGQAHLTGRWARPLRLR